MAPFTVTVVGYPKAAFSSTGLPAGLTLSAAGTLSGTPSVSDPLGDFPVTITASSGAGTTTQNFTLNLTP